MKQLFLRLRPIFVFTGLFSFVVNLLMLAPPIFMMQVFDRVMASKSVPTLTLLMLGAFFSLFVMLAMEILRSKLLVVATLVIDRQLGPRVIRELISQTSRLRPNEQQASLRDINTLRNYMTGYGVFAIFDAPWLIVYLGLIYLFSPFLGLCATFGVATVVVLTILSEHASRNRTDEIQKKLSESTRFFDAALRNAEVVTALGMGDNIAKRWFAKNQAVLDLQVDAANAMAKVGAWTRFSRQFFFTAMTGIGVFLVIAEQTSPGVMLAATTILARAMMPVEMLLSSWTLLAEARSAYRRLDALLARPEAHDSDVVLPAPKGHVQVENLFFAPPGATKPILRGINLDIQPGESLGIVGPSASGKSTLARLMIGLWRPSSGFVRLDAADMSSWPRDRIGEHLGYLPQDVELFAGTVAENIARLGEIDSDKIVRAAQRARVHEMILRLPNGYETQIGEGGAVLSGGQRQRVALARALYGDPKVVILDEPNANLDFEGEHALQEAMRDLKAEGVTLIVIAHRPSLFGSFDRLLVLREGVIEFVGPAAQALARFGGQAAGPQLVAQSA